MVLGSCTYDACDHPLMLSHPDELQMPARLCHKCEGCNRTIRMKVSRIEPKSWTAEGFDEAFVVDEETRKIESRTLTFMEGDVVTAVMKFPEHRELFSFAEGLLEDIAYQKGEVRKMRLKDSKR